jgi:HTH-type transcriptional regulator / antitoxin HigA
MAAEPRTWQPDWVVTPGDLLLEALEDRDMTQSDLARRMGRPIKTINEIVNGKAAITPDTAIQLERTLGITADFWNNLEGSYRAQLARLRSEEELAQYKSWASAFPIKDLVRRNLIEESTTRAGTVAALLRFFGVGNPDAWDVQWLAPAASFRASPAFKSSPYAAAAWLRWGELLAARIETEPFDAPRLRDILTELRPLTRRDLPLIHQRIESMFASAGVAFVLTPELRGVRLSGAARWIGVDKSLIQVSLRHKTEDQFWFTVFHEARHLLGRKHIDFVDDEDSGQAAADDADEVEADRFARDTLLPPDDYDAFVAACDFSASAIRAFAKNQNIATGIVVGRLQRDKHVPRTHHRDLKKSVSFTS